MPAPNLTEYGKLSSLGLIRHYQQNQSWYIQQGKVFVAAARFGASATNPASGSAHVFSHDEVASILRLWLIGYPQWRALLQSKPHLPNSQYDFITDAMARHVAHDAYIQIIS
jgi:hypothetical protein